MIARLWNDHVLPHLVEKACRSHVILDERRRWVPEARGHVLEVGVGSGLNLAFYDPQRVSDVIGVDVSVPLLARAAERITGAPVPVTLVEGDAERLAFDRARFDTVLVTYTLCSVRDMVPVLAEIKRVLRADGTLVIVEHGLSPDPKVQRWQRRITPVWRRIAGNCHLDRDIPHAIDAAGFTADQLISNQGEGISWLSFTSRGAVRLR